MRDLTNAALDDWRDPNTLHLDEPDRRALGGAVADFVAAEFHRLNPGRETAPLCPGCFMVVLFYAACTLELRLPRPDLALLAESFIGAWHRFGVLIRSNFPADRAQRQVVSELTGEPS